MRNTARISFTLIVIILIIYSIGSPLLGVYGEHDNAVITSIRRQGKHDEIICGRYNYSIDYTLTLSDRYQINDTSTYMGDDVYLEADGASTIPIRYLKQNPYINLLKKAQFCLLGNLFLAL